MSDEKDARARILIVEDELIIAENLKYRLEKLGYSVTGITIDAEETRASLTEEVPDLVLMDIALYGGNDGVILAKWIDKQYGIPVIYVTSHTDNSTFERASKSMPYGYLIKPFNPKELYNTIELALQRHRLLKQLSTSSHLLGSVLQSIGDAIVVADKQKSILYMNDSAEYLLENRYEDVRKMSMEELLLFRDSEDDTAPPGWDLAKIPEHEEVEFECRLQTPSRINFLQVRLSHLNNELRQNIPEGYLIVMRDITARRKTENIIMKVAGAVSGVMGEAFFQTLTARLTETLEMDYCLLGELHEDDPNRCTIAAASSGRNEQQDFTSIPSRGTPIEEILSRRETVFYLNEVQQKFPKDDILKNLDVRGYAGTPLISSDGHIVGVIIVMSRKKLEETEILKSVLTIFANRATAEIERRKYEQRLITERNRANELNTLKNNFLSNMSHEVRTPLNSIIGFASLLGEELHDKEHQEFLNYIEEGGQRLLQTINDLLDLSILESEPDKIATRKINLETDVSEAVGMMSNQARDKDIILDYVVNKHGVEILGDPRMTGQVLRKLIGNAIKFTDNGSVLIEVNTAMKNNNPYGVVRIKDTGIGIDKEFQPYIFDEFTQESWGMTRKFEGVGLGLTIAQKMTHLMNGIIEAESEKGKGSVFSVYLPLADNHSA